MSPFLKSVGVGFGVLAVSVLIMWLTTRILNRPFLGPLPRPRATTSPAPATPTFAPLFSTAHP